MLGFACLGWEGRVLGLAEGGGTRASLVLDTVRQTGLSGWCRAVARAEGDPCRLEGRTVRDRGLESAYRDPSTV